MASPPGSLPSFTIQIDEAQRALIEKALSSFFADETEEVINSDPGNEHVPLLDLIRDLPKQERESPRTIHGFCL